VRAIAALAQFFGRAREVAAVYLYGRYASGPSFPDTDLEVGLVFPPGVEDEEIRDYLERLSDANPLGGEPGMLMPFALNTHIPQVVHEILTGGTVLVDNDPDARAAFAQAARARIEREWPAMLDDAREAITQARALGLAATAASGYVLPQPPRFLDPIRVGWRLGRVLASVAVIEATTRDLDAVVRDPDRIGQVVGWFSNASGAATGIAKAMLSIFEMERPPRRWQVFIPVADAGLIPMDLALALGGLVELRWQLLAGGGMVAADRIVTGVRGGLPHLLAFARQAAWYCELPGGRGDAKVH
jgi:hypothetical protein